MSRSLKPIRKERILDTILDKIPRKKFYLRQRDFRKGTFRITEPGRYILKENIVFAPNPNNRFRPRPDQEEYKSLAYSLGFFAAITIEADGVEIDLNGKELRQSDEMAWMQRFYANIETASTPFIPNQGPGNFGPVIVSPKYIYIHNGILGRSSHHAIHGNSNQYVYIEDVRMVDYEFIGSALNGSNYVVHSHCDIRHNFRDVKVLASWSTALFAQQFMEDAEKYVLQNNPKLVGSSTFKTFRTGLKNLTSSIEATRKILMNGGEVIDSLYKNPSKVGDGNMYGILSYPRGFAINAFTTPDVDNVAKHWLISDCKIRHIKGNVDEVITVQDPEGKVQKGPAGDVLKLKDCVNKDGTYRHNPIADGIIALASLKQLVPSLPVGTLHVHPNIIQWASGNLSFSQLLRNGFSLWTTQDSMAHHNKGILGIRLDGTRNVQVKNVEIKDIQNIGRAGSELGKKRYIGCLSSGIHLAYITDALLENLKIQGIESQSGLATGIQLINQSTGIVIRNSLIKDIVGGIKDCKKDMWEIMSHDGKPTQFRPTLVNPICGAIGIAYTKDSAFRDIDVKIKDLQGPKTKKIAQIE
jgi:hypothetical protein